MGVHAKAGPYSVSTHLKGVHGGVLLHALRLRGHLRQVARIACGDGDVGSHVHLEALRPGAGVGWGGGATEVCAGLSGSKAAAEYLGAEECTAWGTE